MPIDYDDLEQNLRALDSGFGPLAADAIAQLRADLAAKDADAAALRRTLEVLESWQEHDRKSLRRALTEAGFPQGWIEHTDEHGELRRDETTEVYDVMTALESVAALRALLRTFVTAADAMRHALAPPNSDQRWTEIVDYDAARADTARALGE